MNDAATRLAGGDRAAGCCGGRAAAALAALWVTLQWVPLRAEAAGAPSLSDKIDRIVREVRQAARYPGLAVAVGRDNRVIYAKGEGLADIENGIAMTADTVMPIGSVTKSMTNRAILQLADQGKIDLRRPLRTYLPDYIGPGSDVLLLRMLNHTSGIPSYAPDPTLPDEQTPIGVHSIVERFRTRPLEFESGTRFSYNNSDTYLLGLVIERVSGTSYADYLKREIFHPFGMRQSTVADSSDLVHGRGSGYILDKTSLRNAPAYDISFSFSAGGAMSTVTDLVRYGQGLFDSKLSSPTVRANTIKIEPLPDGSPMQYALGALGVSEWNGHTKLEHDGVISGFSTHFAHYPNDRLTIAVIGNLTNPAVRPGAVERRVARAALGIPEPNQESAPISREELRNYSGVYVAGPVSLNFFERDGALFFVGMRSPVPVQLRHLGKRRFVSALDSDGVFEFRGATAQVSELVLPGSGIDAVFIRK